VKDPALENDLRLLTLQAESWKRLHDFMNWALDKAAPMITLEQERQFTELRGILLQESEHVLSELDLSDELLGKTLNLLNRATSMRAMRELSGIDARRLEMDWNVIFAKMGTVLGQLKKMRKEFSLRKNFAETLAQFFRPKRARG
jgi:hypothetical protein